MPSQTIIWTALPNGLDGLPDGRKILKLSVFVAPRLRATPAEGETLKLWPDFLDWPARMQTASFKVQFAGGPTLDATVDKSKLDSKLWGAIFNPDTFVRAHTFDNYSGRQLISYPARKVYDGIKESYQITGREFPHGWGKATIEGGGTPLGFARWSVPWDAAAEAAARAKLDVPADELNPTDVTARVLLFHRRPAEDRVQLPQDAAGHGRTLDFHQALSALGDYPALLRHLGLVLDLTLPLAGVPPTVTAVQVLPTFAPAPGTVARVNRAPKTAVTLDAARFRAASSSGAIVDGLLALDERQYDLVPLDLDGNALKVVNTALTAGRHENDRFGDGPPALRSAGIALVEEDQATRTRSFFGRAQANNAAVEAGGDVTLFADDLVRGLRVDIWDERTEVWRSLCRRVGSYTFEALGETKTIEDEGCVEPALAEAAAPKPGVPNDLYLHEALVRWEGWSLAAPRPGRVGGVDGGAAPEAPDNAALTPFKLRVDFAPVGGSLPGLRFGRRYRLRARVADLAGNSASLETAPDVGLPTAPRAFAYLRYERIAPPILVPRAPVEQPATPGESVDRLVLRTANADPSKDVAVSAAIAERHVVPARVSALFAETHGVVDGPTGAPRANAYTTLKEKDAGELKLDPATGRPVEPAPQLVLPYLPDPLSRGPALRALPGAPEGAIGRIDATTGKLIYTPDDDHPLRGPAAALLDWGVNASWPNYQPFRIVLREGSGPPTWDRATRVLTVFLPKGATARVPLSSYLTKDDLKLMGVWEWLREDIEEDLAAALAPLDGGEADAVDRFAQRLAGIAQLALEGGHALLTPSRKVQFIHAVQQPRGRPFWRKLVASRPTGGAAATFDGELQIDGATTANVAIRARWEESVDFPNEAGPRVRGNDVVVADLPIPAPAGLQSSSIEDVAVAVGGVTVARYDFRDDRLLFATGATPRHTLGDTKHRTIRYKAVSTSRFREFFPQGAPGGFTRESDEFTISLPSTTRPAPPRLLYVLPTFGWKRQTETNLAASRRLGHGVRVYLDRPWFSSGDGEMLAVVYRSPLAGDAPLQGLVTEVGNDPVVLGTADARLFFGAGGVQVPGLTLEGLPPAALSADAFPVQFDGERKLWYCDFQFDTDGTKADVWGAFARLALARYQPNALPGIELSRPVLADFVQTAPDRFAVATSDPYDRGTVRLTVSGLTLRAKANVLGIAQTDGTAFDVTVETRRPNVDGDLGWMPAPANLATVERDLVLASGNSQVLWGGRITLPADRQPGQFRIVIREFESWFDDAAVAAGGANPTERARRLIYAEALVLA